MRKMFFMITAVFLMIPVFALTSMAQDCRHRKQGDSLLTKLAWGVVDVIYAPAGFVKTVTCRPYDRGLAHDIPAGIGEGLGNMTKRAGAGAYEVATFPLPIPRGYGPVLKEEQQRCCMDNYEGGER